jgi:hypothetical protein
LYYLSIPQNKAPHYVLISLSLSLSLSKLILQKRHAYKKIWAHEGPSEKKSWTHEGPRKKKKENKEKISLSIEELK